MALSSSCSLKTLTVSFFCCSSETLRLCSLFKLYWQNKLVVSNRKIESCSREQSNTMAWSCVHVTAEAGSCQELKWGQADNSTSLEYFLDHRLFTRVCTYFLLSIIYIELGFLLLLVRLAAGIVYMCIAATYWTGVWYIQLCFDERCFVILGSAHIDKGFVSVHGYHMTIHMHWSCGVNRK